MSDCPDCDNAGWIESYAESWDADGNEVGEFYWFKCDNWRHYVRPTLGEIASALKAGVPLADIPGTHNGEWHP